MDRKKHKEKKLKNVNQKENARKENTRAGKTVNGSRKRKEREKRKDIQWTKTKSIAKQKYEEKKKAGNEMIESVKEKWKKIRKKREGM